jgi:hypothetical protein
MATLLHPPRKTRTRAEIDYASVSGAPGIKKPGRSKQGARASLDQGAGKLRSDAAVLKIVPDQHSKLGFVRIQQLHQPPDCYDLLLSA